MIKIVNNRKKNLELDLIPLINIVFLLLIFFMLTSSSITSALKADLPEARSSQKIQNKNHVLKISESGGLEFNGKPVNRREMIGQIENLMEANKTKTLELQGDKNMSFKLFGGIVSDVRKAGIENFIFATQNPTGNQEK
jgi:biopolymer transport protein ExbD